MPWPEEWGPVGEVVWVAHTLIEGRRGSRGSGRAAGAHRETRLSPSAGRASRNPGESIGRTGGRTGVGARDRKPGVPAEPWPPDAEAVGEVDWVRIDVDWAAAEGARAGRTPVRASRVACRPVSPSAGQPAGRGRLPFLPGCAAGQDPQLPVEGEVAPLARCAQCRPCVYNCACFATAETSSGVSRRRASSS